MAGGLWSETCVGSQLGWKGWPELIALLVTAPPQPRTSGDGFLQEEYGNLHCTARSEAEGGLCPQLGVCWTTGLCWKRCHWTQTATSREPKPMRMRFWNTSSPMCPGKQDPRWKPSMAFED
ncbi:unnamed protein product [Rangifer tarandus platyrhynchus]|uniref:Uncharacterized protein n=1 Tax=Rangifer tarandus platyrhynchus TaxID=3082113 RepID=A0AC60A045_RANTA